MCISNLIVSKYIQQKWVEYESTHAPQELIDQADKKKDLENRSS